MPTLAKQKCSRTDPALLGASAQPFVVLVQQPKLDNFDG